MECLWISVQTLFDCFLSLLFMFQIVKTVLTVTVRTELSIRKAITVSTTIKFLRKGKATSTLVMIHQNVAVPAFMTVCLL